MQGSEVFNLSIMVRSGHYASVMQLANSKLVKEADPNGRTVLIESADIEETNWQYAKCIELLLHLGADAFAVDAEGDSAAHVAARRDNLRLLALLPFDAKFLVNKKTSLTPLMVAVESERWMCTKHLLHLFRQEKYYDDKEAKLSAKNKNGQTILEIAEELQLRDMVAVINTELKLSMKADKLLELDDTEKALCNKLSRMALQCDMDGLLLLATCVNVDLPDEYGRTAAMHAAASEVGRNGLVLDMLTKKMKADPTACRVNGWAGLHDAACGGGDPKAIEALVTAGASVNATVGAWGRTPLTLAVEYDNPKGVEDLLRLGANWEVRSGRNGKKAKELVNGVQVLTLLNRCEGRTFFSDLSYDFNPGEEYYPVTDPQGYCLIINVNKYDAESGLKNRDGSEKDVERINEVFGVRLGFIVKTKIDGTAEEIRQFIGQIASSKELAKHGCLICFLMAHGDEDAIFGRDGLPCNMDWITKHFQPNMCRNLNGKPKIFIVQACRGRHDSETQDFNAGEQSRSLIEEDAVKVNNSKLIPRTRDLIMYFSTSRGSSSSRNVETGSLFIQTLCKLIEENYLTKDLLGIMTMVNHKINNTPVEQNYRSGNREQTPQALHHLAKMVCLSKKGPRNVAPIVSIPPVSSTQCIPSNICALL